VRREGEAAGGTAGRVLLWLAAAFAAATALRLPAAWASGNALNHVSGAWMTLADDLARGTLYRPLHDAALGYGGTRNLPLAFALHAALLRAGAPLLASGWALALAAGALLVSGGFLLLRALGAPRGRALAFAALALGGFAAQHALSAIRGDLLPVALSALALAALVRLRGAGRLAAAAALLALAFAAKPTALTAAGAAALWLALRGERRAAAALAGATALLALAVLVATDALSGGRFLAILRDCAVDVTPRGLLRAPLRFAEDLVLADPAGLALAAAAAVAALAAAPGVVRALRAGTPAPPVLLPALWLAAAGAGAVVVYASPGAGMNHLVELEAASALLLGAATLGPAPRAAWRGAPVAAGAALAMALATWRADARTSRLAEVRAAIRALPPGPILSEDPTVPLLAGARPVVLDPWMLRIASARHPEISRTLAAELARGRYAAVVLFEDLDGPAADAWYADRNLGLPLAREIRRRYRQSAALGRYHVYVPRGAGTPGEPRVSAAAAPAAVVAEGAPR
jgi:hypothetical protein